MKFSKHADLTPAELKLIDALKHMLDMIKEEKSASMRIAHLESIQDQCRKIERRMYWSQE